MRGEKTMEFIDREKKLFGVMFLAIITFAAIVSADVPHILRNGKIVDADELNSNFSYLESLTPFSQRLYSTYAAGVPIGKSRIDKGKVFLRFNPEYKALPLMSDGRLIIPGDKIVFAADHCAGAPYVEFSDYPMPSDRFPIAPLYGEIFSIGESLYYYPPKTSLMKVAIPISAFKETSPGEYACESLLAVCVNGYRRNSLTGEMACDNHDLGIFFYGFPWRVATGEEIAEYLKAILIPVSRNEPSVTGLPDASFNPPIVFDGVDAAEFE